MTSRRCMPKTTPRTSTRVRPTTFDVVERPQSEAPVTCLRDLCSIRSRASMVHKRKSIICLPFCSLCLHMECRCFPQSLRFCFSPSHFIFWLYFLLDYSSLNNILQIYSCVNFVFLTFSIHSRSTLALFTHIHQRCTFILMRTFLSKDFSVYF